MTRNPYPGLRSFEPADSELFFGRESETDDLRRRLRSTRFLAVVGASGSGKSSLVRCGLIPSLHAGLMSGAGDAWRVAIFRPGDDPIGQLATALDQPGLLRAGEASAPLPSRYAQLEAGLRDSSLGLAETVRQAQLPAGARLLLVVDQFEELFRYRRVALQRSGRSDAAAFVRLLIEAARHTGAPVYLVLTMRAEFIGECMAFDGLAEVINAGQYLIPRMSRDAMRQAIAGPAAVRGAQLAPRLLVRLLNEVGDDLDRLPVLQHALMRTWQAWERDHRDGEPLDIRHYEAIGTTREALSRHAEEAWQDLATPEARALAERLWKTLTETSDSGLLNRRPTALAALSAICEAPPQRVREVIELFRLPERGFLQPPAGQDLGPDTVIDITHESLMRLWPRLGEWIREEARATEIYRRLLRSARQHQAGEASLWRAPELGLGLKWQATQRPNAAWAGNADDFALATTYLQRSRRAQTTRHALAAAGLAAVVGGLAFMAYSQAALAESRDRLYKAEAGERAAQQREVEALTDQLGELKKTHRLEEQQLALLTPELEALRIKYDALKSEVSTLSDRRSRLEASIRQAATEQMALQFRIEAADQRIDIKNEQGETLNQEIGSLNTISSTLYVQNETIHDAPSKITQTTQEIETDLIELEREEHRLENTKREIRWCRPQFPITGSGWIPPGVGPFRTQPQNFEPHASIIDATYSFTEGDLKGKIDALARRLLALTEQHARSESERKFLTSSIQIMTEQRTALRTSIHRFEQVLSDSQKNIAHKTSMLASVAAEELTIDHKLNRQKSGLAELQTSIQLDQRLLTGNLKSTKQAIDRLAELESRRQSAKRNIKWMKDSINNDAIQPLLGREDGTAIIRTLFAIQAYRWAPYDANDGFQPQIYNGLWHALDAIDRDTAHRFVDPRMTPAGEKIATTQSAQLVKALCARVNRPLTEAEWAQRFPRDEQGRWTSVCYPQKPNPCDP